MELEEADATIPIDRWRRALRFLDRNMPENLRDRFAEYVEKLEEKVEKGERLVMGDIVADLLDPRKFRVRQQVVEEFLRFLFSDHPQADRIVTGVIEYAKRKVWGGRR